MKLYKRAAALVLTAATILSLVPPVSAEDEHITISSAKEFYALVQSCTRDVWSQGVTVELTADLDLSGSDFQPIPIFQGTFHGNGHTIRSITYDHKGSTLGLFRTLTESAVVENLSVEGLLEPQGSASQLGLLAGENYGTIRSCSAKGTVSGQEDVGGLVGVNGETGRIEGSSSQAQISGVTNVGGIAGQNLGTLDQCINTGTLNSDPDQEIPTSVGGIAGLSRGTIQSCSNSGEIGYQHLGYNMGGIVGLQSGSVLQCSNTGQVWGRKDVGGIVGQFEPNADVTYGDSPMDRLNNSLAALFDEMEVFANQVNVISSRGVEDAQVIHDALSSIQDRTYDAGKDGKDDFQAMSDDLYQYTNDISAALDSLRDHVDRFSDDAFDDLNELLDQADRLSLQLNDLLDHLDSGLSDAVRAMDRTVNGIRDQAQAIKTHLAQIKPELDALKQYIRDIAKLIAEKDFEGALQLPFPTLNLKEHIEGIHTALKKIPSLLLRLPNQWREIFEQLSDDLGDDRDRIQRVLDALNDTASHLVNAGDRVVDQISGDLDEVDLGADLIRELLKNYTDQLGDKAQAAVDDIDAQLDVIQSRVDQMTQYAGQDTQELHATTLSIIQHLDVVRQAIYDLGKKPEITITDLTDVTQGPGLISGCSVSCTVNGDANVGGIAGNVSPELGDDPEETLEMDDLKLLADVYATMRAVIRSCRFNGDVVVKNDCGGGIAGRCELGAILDSAARGTVETGTDYCGGIAGRTKGSIIRCSSLVDLTGESWLGGVAGLGEDLLDCRAMVRAQGDGEFWGAIAGQAEGDLAGNRYLMEDLAGLDGVDYAELAQGLDFDSFRQLNYLPEDFLTFSYRFNVNGSLLAEVPFSYGGDLDLKQIPASPEQNGQYGQWPFFPTQDLRRSMVLEAEFEDPTSTLASGEDIPTLLAQGIFSPDAKLTIHAQPVEEDMVEGCASVGAWTYSVTGSKEDTVILRLRTEGAEHPDAALYQDGHWSRVEGELDGSYLVFQAPVQGQVLLLDQRELPVLAAALCGGGMLALLLVLFLIRRRRQGKAPAVASQSDGPSQPVG